MSAKTLIDLLLRRVSNLEEAANRSGYKPRPIILPENLPLQERMKLRAQLDEKRSLIAAEEQKTLTAVERIEKEIAAADLTRAALYRSLQSERARYWGGPREKLQAEADQISHQLLAARLIVLDDILSRIEAESEATLDASANLITVVERLRETLFVGSIRHRGGFYPQSTADLVTRLRSPLQARLEILEPLAQEVRSSWHELPLDEAGYLALIDTRLANLPPIPEELKVPLEGRRGSINIVLQGPPSARA